MAGAAGGPPTPVESITATVGDALIETTGPREGPRADTAPFGAAFSYRALADASPLPAWTMLAGGEVTYFNERWDAYTGLLRNEGLGHGWMQVVHPDDIPRLLALRDSLDTPTPVEVEARFRRHDGAWRWHLCRATPLAVDEHGRGVWLGMAVDIDERVQTEEALRDALERLRLSDERSRLAEEAAHFGTWEWDMGERVHWSESLERIYGFAPGTYPGTFEAFLERVHPDDRETTVSRIQAAVTSGEDLDFEHRIILPDGTVRWLNGRGRVIRVDGKPVRMVGIGIDMTERREAEDALRESHERERLLAEISGHLVSSLEPQVLLAQIARDCVPAIADICTIGLFDESEHTRRFETAGVTPEEAPHVARTHLRRWWTDPSRFRTVGQAMEAGDPVVVRDVDEAWIRGCAPDDAQVAAGLATGAVSLLCLPLLARGETIGMVTFAQTRSRRRFSDRDVAFAREIISRASIAVDNARLFGELQETADRLRQANAAKDEFLGLMSHELKTPITVILGNAHVLARAGENVDPETRRAALQDIRDESERLNRIIEDLLVLARLERGKELEIEPVDVRKLIARVVAAAQRDHPGRTIEVRCGVGGGLVEGSEVYIEQVLRNLIGNALKYSPRDRPIEVECREDGGAVTVAVLDRGVGLTEEELGQLFTPFYRSPRVRAQAQGVGIGLAVCKRLLDALGGTLEARPREGGGSEFRFSLPAAAEDEL
jgi:PAS domain S-box-containing protein